MQPCCQSTYNNSRPTWLFQQASSSHYSQWMASIFFYYYSYIFNNIYYFNGANHDFEDMMRAGQSNPISMWNRRRINSRCKCQQCKYLETILIQNYLIPGVREADYFVEVMALHNHGFYNVPKVRKRSGTLKNQKLFAGLSQNVIEDNPEAPHKTVCLGQVFSVETTIWNVEHGTYLWLKVLQHWRKQR